MKNHHLLILIITLIGCTPVNNTKPKEWPQKCQTCGTEWLITPNNPNETIPPTIEWCFHDGKYCETGLTIIIKQSKNKQSNELNNQFINHCLECKGCRYAAFNPEEWKKITNTIKLQNN